uniref:FERM, ARHGEF and pleckstrin domain-containing protein 1 n=1 Tax=Chelydra serpentina TaxID=8475 RepID=A0A8C3TH16_CHESE
MGETEQRPTAGSRLGAQENAGISTLEHGQKLPMTPPGKLISIKIQMLDDTQEVFDVPQRAPGKVLLDAVCNHLNLVEGDYFGLEFPDHKKIMCVVCDFVRFCVCRYLFALQVKQDLVQGRLTCNDTSAALLISHIVQSEIGDFDETIDREHLAKNKYIPQQETLEDKIMEFHRSHIGQTPAESDFQLLEIARRLEMYGIRLHPAKDREGTKINLAVANTGILVFQGHTKINAFNWAKVRKLSFKRKRFLIKLRPDVNNSFQDTLEFLMASRDFCKSFWKICVEHHAFFRLFEEPKPKPKPVLFTRGSSFRFSGRTQKQVLDYVKEGGHKKVHCLEMPCSNCNFYCIISLAGSLTGSPHLSELSINSQGAPVVANMSLSPNLSPDAKQSSPLVSPLLNDPSYIRTDDEEEVRRKRFPTDKAYFIAKEVSTTERTYLKDLEVITSWFQSTVSKDDYMPETLKNLLFSSFEPLHKFHTSFLKEIEQRLALWEGRSNAHIKGDYQRIGDVMLKNIQSMKQLTVHLRKHNEVLMELENGIKNSRKLENLCRDFELQKVCYLPLNTFLLRPLHRLMHYKQIMERLCKHYPPNHVDFRDSRAALAEISEMVAQLHGSMIKMENFQKLHELKKDLIGIDNLAIPGREFIRLGSLSKLSGKGLQQRMFFLVSDENKPHWTFMFNNFSNHVCCKKDAFSLNFIESPDETTVDQESEDDLSASRTSLERQSPHRGNTTVHVCWHRNTSVSMIDFSIAVENQLSGNLLRKFKNSNGWQKLWVVFTNFCMFFYKSHQDNHPLASLPLLGYSLTIPSESENIHKDYVFKLHFKSHVYYFRAESEYTFERYVSFLLSGEFTCPTFISEGGHLLKPVHYCKLGRASL